MDDLKMNIEKLIKRMKEVEAAECEDYRDFAILILYTDGASSISVNDGEDEREVIGFRDVQELVDFINKRSGPAE